MWLLFCLIAVPILWPVLRLFVSFARFCLVGFLIVGLLGMLLK